MSASHKTFYISITIDNDSMVNWIDTHVIVSINLINEWVGREMLVIVQ